MVITIRLGKKARVTTSQYIVAICGTNFKMAYF